MKASKFRHLCPSVHTLALKSCIIGLALAFVSAPAAWAAPVAPTRAKTWKVGEKIPELKTLSGKTYRNVTVHSITPSQIRILHESGAAGIKLEDLSADLKAKFGYDPEKVKALKITEAEKEKAKADAIAKALEKAKAEELANAKVEEQANAKAKEQEKVDETAEAEAEKVRAKGSDLSCRISAGSDNHLAIDNHGTVVAWETKLFKTDKVIQYKIPIVKDVVAVSASNHYLVLQKNGKVISWTNRNKNLYCGECDIPRELKDVVAISAGSGFSLALQKDGRVVAWGGKEPPLGLRLPSLGECNVPVGLSDVVAISAGGGHSLALRRGGTVVAWGRNDKGQCAVPVGLKDVVAVSAGTAHSLALQKDGKVVAWCPNSENKCVIPGEL